MTKKIIDGITITADFDCSVEELENYVEYVDRNVDEPVDNIVVSLQPDGSVDITWTRHNQKFERIRRITGYLVGTLERWNIVRLEKPFSRIRTGRP